MNSEKSKPSCPSDPACSPSIHLTIRGLGHVPSFKNSRVLFLTNPRNRVWMEWCQDRFESQFASACPTGVAGMPMAPCPQSWIRFVVPLDDSVDWIPELHVLVERVKKGDEGADILIERL
jgi:hypothetical protein